MISLRAIDNVKGVTSKIEPNILVVLALPFLLLTVNNHWIFTNAFAGFIDPWIYLGYFLRFAQHFHTYPGTYYGTRLSWLVPGHLIYQLFPPLIANYVLHLGVYYASVISLYLILKYTLNRRVALLGAILMGGYPPFLRAVGWDYPDGVGIAYFLLTTLMLTRAAKFSSWRVSICLSGLFYGALIYSNLFWLVFTPTLVIYYWFANREFRKNSLYLSAAFFLVGLAITTVILGTVNYFINGNFLFFLPTVNYLNSINFSRNVSYYDASYKWIFNPTHAYLRPIYFTCLSCFIFFFISRKRSFNNKRFILFHQINFILIILMMIFWESKGWPTFQYFYYASTIIPLMFMALTSQFSEILENLSTRKFFIITCVTIISLIVSLTPSSWLSSLSGYNLLISLLVFSGLALAIYGFNSQLMVKSIAGLSTVILLLLAFSLFNFRYLVSPAAVSRIDTPSNGFMAVVKSARTLEAFVPELQTIVKEGKRLFWYDAKAPLGGVYTSVASTYLWMGLLVNDSFPSLYDKVNNKPIIQLSPNTKIVLLSDEKDALVKANEALKRINLKAKILSEQEIRSGKVKFNMTFVETQRQDSQ